MDYHQKYLKYKNKYTLLKQFKNNNNLEGGIGGYWYSQIVLGYKKLKDVPREEKTESLCLTAIKIDSLELKYVDPKISNYDVLCEIALKKNGLALEHVPLYKKSEDFYKLYKIALANNGLALKYVPFLQRTDELCKIAITNNGLALEHVPLKTDELCKIAITNNGLALEHVPLKTDELCEIAFNNNKDAYYFAPEHMQIKFHNETQAKLREKNKKNMTPVYSKMPLQK